MSETSKQLSLDEQLPLFKLSRADGDLSQQFSFYDSVCKFIYSGKKGKVFELERGNSYREADFQWRGLTADGNKKDGKYRVRLKAAVMGDGGEEKFFFPGAEEEIIYFVLRKLAAVDGTSVNDHLALRVTIGRIKAELASMGRTKSYAQIVESLTILRGAQLEIFHVDGHCEYKGMIGYFSNLTFAHEKGTDNDGYCQIIFDPLVAKEIINGRFREYDYRRVIKIKNDLARFLANKLYARFSHANTTNAYSILLKTVFREMYKQPYKTNKQMRKYALEALEELKEVDIIKSYDIDSKFEYGSRKKVEDYLLIMTPSMTFINHQKLAHAKARVRNTIHQINQES